VVSLCVEVKVLTKRFKYAKSVVSLTTPHVSTDFADEPCKVRVNFD
jgi:hypothetical protein